MADYGLDMHGNLILDEYRQMCPALQKMKEVALSIIRKDIADKNLMVTATEARVKEEGSLAGKLALKGHKYATARDITDLLGVRVITFYSDDVDKIADQQNTVSRLETKIIDRLVKAGTRITLPDRADLRTDPEDGERWFIGSPADKSMIGLYEFSGNLQFEMAYLNQVYEEARQALGITDSFQGRRDETATSGVAKQFAAAQTAGRRGRAASST